MLFNQLIFIYSLLISSAYAYTQQEIDNANVVLWVCIVVGVLISISGCGAAGFFYMMRKRNSNQGQVMVVH